MNNLSSDCGLVDAKIRASDKDLPVTKLIILPTHISKNTLLMVRTLMETPAYMLRYVGRVNPHKAVKIHPLPTSS
jgi:hypothetical protein